MNAASDMIAIAKKALLDMRDPVDVLQYRNMMRDLKFIANLNKADTATLNAYERIMFECDKRLRDMRPTA